MTVKAPMLSKRRYAGVELISLRNDRVEVVVAPELGAKVVTLRNSCTGRDWFEPLDPPKLFRNKVGDDFASSTLLGWDECLPTIAPCSFAGRVLPDHGEVWSVPWCMDDSAAASVRGSVELGNSGLTFSRDIGLEENSLTATYELTNQGSTSQRFLWAMHPLIVPRDGDRVILPAEARQQLTDARWLDSLDLGGRIPAFVKAFATGLTHGRAAVVNDRSGDCVKFEWNPSEINTVGIWLTRGGWHGCHHLALEPTNAPADSLADAAANDLCGTVEPGATKSWSVRMVLEP